VFKSPASTLAVYIPSSSSKLTQYQLAPQRHHAYGVLGYIPKQNAIVSVAADLFCNDVPGHQDMLFIDLKRL
jgi:hypothetical protein